MDKLYEDIIFIAACLQGVSGLDIYVFVCIFWLFHIKRNLSLDT